VFGALGKFVSRKPWIVIGVWLVFAVLVVAFSPKLESTADQSEFLPDHYESVKGFDQLAEDFPDTNTSIAATVVFDREDGDPLSQEDLVAANAAMASIEGDLGKTFDGFLTPDPSQPDLVVVPSENSDIGFAQLLLSPDLAGFEPEALDDARELRKDVQSAIEGTGLEAGVTGNVASSVDNEDASGDALLIVGVATITLIVLLLALILRSVLICLLPVVVVGLVSMVATGLIGAANAAFDLKADSSVEQILVVVLYGVGTDYILFFLFRYRERLREGEEKREAVAHALERAGEAIASAGGAVIVSFMALILSSLGVFRAIGPALAIAVAVTLVASLTLVPAIVTLLGKALFWPSKKYMIEPKAARFEAVGKSLGKHPLRFALASGGVLAVLAVFALSFNPSFDFSGSSVPKTAESVVAGDKFTKYVSAGASDPSIVILHSTSEEPIGEDDVASFVTALEGADGVQSVVPALANDAGTSHLFSVLLDEKPDGDAAIADIKDSVRPTAHAAAPDGSEALVTGNTAVFVDFQDAMNRDYSVVFPVAALVIILILALLLRSLVAPIYLMLSVGLGFGATLGATVLVFQHLMGDSGLIFILPMYIYLFVVALGTDYNILMIARLREEAQEGLSPRDAAAETVKHGGPTIAAAGVILAGTFASLMLGGNSLLVSMGFAISLGILIAAFVMAMFFTPALTALLGHAAWWPGHGDEKKTEKVDASV
jgi:RND superfamily putative drug exporter